MDNFFISDLHLNHSNIIRYCDRPFRTVAEMNRVLIENWNKTVGKEDTVFFLGDLAFGRYPEGWLKKLNGHIIFIKGSHDSIGIHSLVLHSGWDEFLLIHNPDQVNGWKQWVIHGHKHNIAPFIDREHKRVNVSAEVVDYTPISLSDIRRMVKCQSKSG